MGSCSQGSQKSDEGLLPQHHRLTRRHHLQSSMAFWTWQRCLLFLGLSFLVIIVLLRTPLYMDWDSHVVLGEEWHIPGVASGIDTDDWCPVSNPTGPPDDGLEDSASLFAGEEVLKKQVERLSAVVDIPTISYDDNSGVDEDTRWNTFGNLHSKIRELFPGIAQGLTLNKINKYGLLYYLDGTDRSLKPMLFMAHQDVVPPLDSSQWTYPPFEAHFDGDFLWGRGSSDCKSNLIAILTAVEALLDQAYRPKRGILLAFGFDEETGGFRGAREIAHKLQVNVGNDSLAMILDEGGMGVKTLGDVAYALPGVAEKGFVDLVLTLETAGGHSSRPPEHTAIGIMSEVVLDLENHAFSPVLTSDGSNPVRNVLQCEAVYSPSHVEPWLRKALASGSDIGERIVNSRGDAVRWQIQTSQAVDIFHGGDKDNSLPSKVEVVVNYRITPNEDADSLLREVAGRVVAIAHKHGIAASGLGFDEDATKKGISKLKSKDLLLPSPITPTQQSSQVWQIFSGTLRQIYESIDTLPKDTRMVVPVGSIATGNSDTAWYWSLTPNIFRFTPSLEGSRLNNHGVDERIQMSSHMESLRFYYDLMRNMQDLPGHVCEEGKCLFPLDVDL